MKPIDFEVRKLEGYKNDYFSVFEYNLIAEEFYSTISFIVDWDAQLRIVTGKIGSTSKEWNDNVIPKLDLESLYTHIAKGLLRVQDLKKVCIDFEKYMKG